MDKGENSRQREQISDVTKAASKINLESGRHNRIGHEGQRTTSI